MVVKGGTEMDDQVKSMGYRQTIIDRLDRQTAKGIVEYGGAIDKSGHLEDAVDALEYLAEELTDGLVYLEHLKALIRRLLEENQRLWEELELSQAEGAVRKGWQEKLQARTIELFEREKKLVETLKWIAYDAPPRWADRAHNTLKELGIE
jgi:hypothetical protein